MDTDTDTYRVVRVCCARCHTFGLSSFHRRISPRSFHHVVLPEFDPLSRCASLRVSVRSGSTHSNGNTLQQRASAAFLFAFGSATLVLGAKVYVKTRPSARLMGNIRRLEKNLGYTFRFPWLCMQAITHPSWTMFDRVSDFTPNTNPRRRCIRSTPVLTHHIGILAAFVRPSCWWTWCCAINQASMHGY